MRKVTLVMAYYDNPGMLEMQLGIWQDLPEAIKKNLKIILVDDCSPTGTPHPRNVGIPITVYRIGVDHRWNQDAARNIGVDRAEDPWVMLTDMDHIVTAETWQHLMFNADIRESVIYTFRRVRAPAMDEYKPHPNSWFMTTSTFKKVWYDERFSGYYGTDGDFKDRAAKVARFVGLKAQLVTVSRDLVPDASTTRYTRKELYDFENVKRIRKERGSAAPIRLSFPYERVS